jgi:hypothetical protein
VISECCSGAVMHKSGSWEVYLLNSWLVILKFRDEILVCFMVVHDNL